MRRHREQCGCADAVSDIADGIARVIEGGLRIPAEMLDDVFDRNRDGVRRRECEKDSEDEGDFGERPGDETISERLDSIEETVRMISTKLHELAGRIEDSQPLPQGQKPAVSERS